MNRFWICLPVTALWAQVGLQGLGTAYFRENKGQVRDQHWRPRWDVLYSGESGGLVYHLFRDGLSFQLARVEGSEGKRSLRRRERISEASGWCEAEVGEVLTLYRVDVKFAGGSVWVVEAGEMLPGHENFYNVPAEVGEVLGVRSYGRVVYRGVWEGVDIEFYRDAAGGMEWDVVLERAELAERVRFVVEGAEAVVRGGELVLGTPLGEVVMGAPVAYQGSRRMRCEWRVERGEVGFALSGCRVGEPVRIDPPVRVWGTYYGGNGWDAGRGCGVDGRGDVFVVGRTESSMGIATAGVHQTSYGGGSMMCL